MRKRLKDVKWRSIDLFSIYYFILFFVATLLGRLIMHMVFNSVTQMLFWWRYCYKLVQGFRVTCLFTGQYNTCWKPKNVENYPTKVSRNEGCNRSTMRFISNGIGYDTITDFDLIWLFIYAPITKYIIFIINQSNKADINYDVIVINGSNFVEWCTFSLQ